MVGLIFEALYFLQLCPIFDTLKASQIKLDAQEFISVPESTPFSLKLHNCNHATWKCRRVSNNPNDGMKYTVIETSLIPMPKTPNNPNKSLAFKGQ